MSSIATSFAPLAAPTGEPIRLAMQRLWLTGRILPAGGRLVIQHVFRSGEDKPLEVIYSFLLPRDAALRAFRITGDSFEAHSELKETEEAVKAYEQGIAEGSLSTLARQYGDGIVNLTVGNIRPNEKVTVHLEILAGVELRDDGFRFRFPFTLAPAYHARMKAARVADGEGELELPAAEFGDVILPRFRDDASNLHEAGFDLSVLHRLPIGEIGSPSHSIRVQHGETARISLAPEKDIPNRDLVLDVRFMESSAQVLSGPTVDGKRNFAAIIPSTAFGVNSKGPRRVVILLDTSGSMQGAPIEQASKGIEACLGALAEDDRFGIVAFSSRFESMDSSLLPGSSENREKARGFLQRLKAGGGTELAAGFTEAARLLAGAGDVLIFTDGQVAGTEQILAGARALEIRLFCLGIGSASQDRFLALLAGETGGVSRFITARERVDLPAVDLFACMGRPVASSLTAAPNIEPDPPPAVFAGTPVLLFGEIGNDRNTLDLTWDSGHLSLPISTGDADTGHTIRLLQGSRLITDWEARYPSEEALAPLEKRKQSRIATRLVELSQRYGLASREMSLVAVVKREGDRPGELPHTQIVPVGMPQDVKPAAYFQPAAQPVAYLASMSGPDTHAMPIPPAPAVPTSSGGSIFHFDALRSIFQRSHADQSVSSVRPDLRPTQSNDDLLLELASELEPDGGMPGATDSARLARTVAAILAFVSQGHTIPKGAFRTHVLRLATYIKGLEGISPKEKSVIEMALMAAYNGNVPPGDWIAAARQPNPPWPRMEKALRALQR